MTHLEYENGPEHGSEGEDHAEAEVSEEANAVLDGSRRSHS